MPIRKPVLLAAKQKAPHCLQVQTAQATTIPKNAFIVMTKFGTISCFAKHMDVLSATLTRQNTKVIRGGLIAFNIRVHILTVLILLLPTALRVRDIQINKS